MNFEISKGKLDMSPLLLLLRKFIQFQNTVNIERVRQGKSHKEFLWSINSRISKSMAGGKYNAVFVSCFNC